MRLPFQHAKKNSSNNRRISTYQENELYFALYNQIQNIGGLWVGYGWSTVHQTRTAYHTTASRCIFGRGLPYDFWTIC